MLDERFGNEGGWQLCIQTHEEWGESKVISGSWIMTIDGIVWPFNFASVVHWYDIYTILYCFEWDSFFEQIFKMVEKFGVKSTN